MVRVDPHRLHGHAYWYAWLATQMGEHALPGPGVVWEVMGAYAPPPKGPDGVPVTYVNTTDLNTRGVEFTPTHALHVSVSLPAHALRIERMFCVAEIAAWEGGPVAALVSLMSGFLGDIHTKYPNIATLAAENTKRT